MMRHVYGEVTRRKKLNQETESQRSVTSPKMYDRSGC